jgi:hypothetical protein
MIKVSLTMTDGPGGILLPMETGGPGGYHYQWRWVGPSGYILNYDGWAGGILFPMEAGGPMSGIHRVDEWANGHEYSIDGWAKVVEYNVYGCTKVDVNQIDEYAKGICYHI